MKRKNKNVLRLVFFFIISIVISACSSLPEHLLKQVEAIPAALEKQKELIATEARAFAVIDEHKEWRYLKPYIEKENWAEYFIAASKQLSDASDFFDAEVLTLAEDNDPKDAALLTEKIALFNEKMLTSLSSAKHVSTRTVFLIKVRNTAPEVHQQSLTNFSDLKKAASQLKQKARKAKADYAHKSADIDKRLDELNLMVNKAAVAVQQVKDQFRKNSSADFAVLGDASVVVASTLQEVIAYQKKTSSKLDELYRSYTKVLVDQEIKYFITIGRASWCNGEYCGSGNTIVYPAAQVDKSVFKFFDEFSKDIVASLPNRRLRLYIPDEIWNALRIYPTWNWISSHNHAEYWVQKAHTKTFHKYAEIVNDKMTEGPWVAVDEDSFWQQFDNLGMSILTKPYGYYEEDALKDAQPVGMATIAKPDVVNGVATGSNQYGSWQQNNGRSFWAYYGMYRMFGDLMGPRRYYYNDWYGYSNHRGGGYYGRNNEYGTWGSGTYSNSRYRNSGYARRNPGDVGRARSGKGAAYRSSSSVRGAGASSRSRGPAGGGK